MLADVWSQVAPPNFFSFVSQRQKRVLLGSGPADIHMMLVDRWRAGGETVEAVLFVNDRLEAPLPKELAVFGAQAKNALPGCSTLAVVRPGQENLLTPYDR